MQSLVSVMLICIYLAVVRYVHLQRRDIEWKPFLLPADGCLPRYCLVTVQLLTGSRLPFYWPVARSGECIAPVMW